MELVVARSHGAKKRRGASQLGGGCRVARGNEARLRIIFRCVALLCCCVRVRLMMRPFTVLYPGPVLWGDTEDFVRHVAWNQDQTWLLVPKQSNAQPCSVESTRRQKNTRSERCGRRCLAARDLAHAALGEIPDSPTKKSLPAPAIHPTATESFCPRRHRPCRHEDKIHGGLGIDWNGVGAATTHLKNPNLTHKGSPIPTRNQISLHYTKPRKDSSTPVPRSDAELPTKSQKKIKSHKITQEKSRTQNAEARRRRRPRCPFLSRRQER
ncbi:hypothetical protein [Oryza sativa Japonica Group]|uniref:Uncharacterized protein n=1 Tax=Oryza sativa subsp. japonica TaxID=39947 RepID=Q5N9Q5_ORYSJ|nr:hypothetical protein [Oryza sativa Japonica Group]